MVAGLVPCILNISLNTHTVLASAEGRTQMSITEQQLELHFGEDYADVKKQSVKFIQRLLSRSWFGNNKQAMLENEGGSSNMAIQALMSIIECDGEIREGLRAYSNRLTLEYGSKKLTDIPLNDDLDYTLPEAKDALGPVRPELSSEELHSLGRASDIILPLTDIEKDFFTTLASVKDIQETSSLLGISYTEGRKVYQRVTMRGKRRLQER